MSILPRSTASSHPTHRARATAALSAGIAAAGVLTLVAGPAAGAISAHPATAAKLPAYGTLWVSNQGNNNLLEFPPGATGETPPIANITGAATLLNEPVGVAIDHHGRPWVANFTSSAITVYGAHANHNAKPVFSIAGSKTTLDEPIGVAMTQAGNLWVANLGNSDLVEFAASARGNVAPIRTIKGPLTLLANLFSVAVNPAGTRVWVSEERTATSTLRPALEEFSGTAHGNVKPLERIAGSKTKLDSPYGIAVGVAGNSPITDDANAAGTFSVLAYAPGTHGNVAPKRDISGAATGLALPDIIALNATGSVWVANHDGNTVTRFGPSQSGNVAPLQTIFGSATLLLDPSGVASFKAPPSAPRAVHTHGTKKTLRITWSAPHVTGGGILGYVVRRAHKKSGPWTTVGTTMKRTYVKAHPHSGVYYDIEAFNDAGFSAVTRGIKPTV